MEQNKPDGVFPFEDLFDNIFFGSEANQILKLSRKEFQTGTVKTVSYNRTILCGDCSGQGGTMAEPQEPCPRCGGTGRLEKKKGSVTAAETCLDCRGRKVKLTRICGKCQGQGCYSTPYEADVEIPPQAGQVKLEQCGHFSPKTGEYGDLIVTIKVKKLF